MGMFDFDNRDFIGVPSGKYFDMVRGIDELTSENEHLKGLNENQMNMIIDLRNEITGLRKQNGDLCELVGKTKKESKDYEAMRNELRSLQDENAARIEAYEKLDKRYAKLSHEYFKLMGENAACAVENYRLRRKLDNGCNTCPDMERTKKKNDELRELIDFKRNQIEEQANTIRDLDKKLAELRAGANESSAEIHDLKRALKSAEDDILEYRKANYALRKQLESPCETCDVPDNCVNASEAVLKDADAKIQSANDKAANAKKEAKQAKETAERYREENFVLHRQIDQFKKLNDELIKELARKGED